MSPGAGWGINYAVQGAVVAANVRGEPLKAGRVEPGKLAEVQRQREWPTRFIQALQSLAQKQVGSCVRRSEQIMRIPWYVRLPARVPIVRDVPARLMAFGIKRVHVEAVHLEAKKEPIKSP